MSTRKMVTLGILGVLVWQHEVLLESKLGGLADLYPTFQTYQSMRAIRDPLAKYVQANRGRPPRNLSQWITRSFQDSPVPNPELDHFGNPYLITRNPNREYEIRSCGPDGQCRNEDDLVVPVGKPLTRL